MAVGLGWNYLQSDVVAEVQGEEIYRTDFSEGLGSEWRIYDSIGHAGWGLRRPSAVTVEPESSAAGGSLLTITARMGSGEEAGLLVSGGLKLIVPQTYGRYTFRMRADGDPSGVTSAVSLLWPASNDWPADGELDIVETWTNRATRTPVETNIHWPAPEATPPYTARDDRVRYFGHNGVDAREWHTYVFEWHPDRLVMTIDDREPVILTTEPLHIPDDDMELTFQLDGFDAFDAPGVQPIIDGEVRLEVDWVVVERFVN
jgi:hypothetical protein